MPGFLVTAFRTHGVDFSNHLQHDRGLGSLVHGLVERSEGVVQPLGSSRAFG